MEREDEVGFLNLYHFGAGVFWECVDFKHICTVLSQLLCKSAESLISLLFMESR